jgi:hypothetical protein
VRLLGILRGYRISRPSQLINYVPQARPIFSLMDALEKFDREAGYPFAWFFYMVHGNRMGRNVGEKVIEGLKTGKIGLPENDKRVLLRWGEHPYRF